MDLPNWINRETIQLALIFVITIGFHYYFISSRIEGMGSGSSSEPDLGLKTQSEWKNGIEKVTEIKVFPNEKNPSKNLAMKKR